MFENRSVIFAMIKSFCFNFSSLDSIHKEPLYSRLSTVIGPDYLVNFANKLKLTVAGLRNDCSRILHLQGVSSENFL